MENIGKIYLQNCGDSLKIIEKTTQKKNGKFLYRGKFQKYPYEILDLISSIKLGKVNNPQIEKVEFIDKIWHQNCGDDLKIIEKSNIKQNGTYLWKCQFINTKEILLCKKDIIIKGKVVKKDDFVGKEFKQNCGDVLKVIMPFSKRKDKIGKYHIIYKCEFLNYPNIVFAEKQNIIKGGVDNSVIEEQEFIGKTFKQNCGYSLKVLRKTNLQNKEKGSFLFECQFLGEYPYICLKTKSEIIEGEVDNLLLPWKTKEGLSNYIDANFGSSPTLIELSKKLNISISHLSNILKIFELQNKIKYYPEGSKGETEIKNFINSLLKEKVNNTWGELDGKEIDIFIPNFNLGFEYNGNYWHSELYRGIIYHQEKSILAKEKGISLFHIWEYEWKEKQDIIKSLIESRLGICNFKIGARKCEIKEISNKEYQNFCEENHLQGQAGAKVKLGLFYKDKLVQIMSFGCPRFALDYEWEIIRECSKLGYFIMGGKEKLWSYFVKNYNPNNCISYCDFSKFTGESYLKLGFEKLRLNKPGFVWFDEKTNNIFWRTPLKNNEYKEKYLKIYDCGQLVFSWRKDKI